MQHSIVGYVGGWKSLIEVDKVITGLITKPCALARIAFGAC